MPNQHPTNNKEYYMEETTQIHQYMINTNKTLQNYYYKALLVIKKQKTEFKEKKSKVELDQIN